MVVTNKEMEESFLFTKKIVFTFNDSEEFIEMREFNMEQSKQFQLASKPKIENGEIVEVDSFATFSKAEEFFPSCVVNSSFVKEDGTQLSGKELYNFLKKSSSLFQEILHAWLEKGDSPFQFQNKKETK